MYKFIKRFFDIVISLTGIIALSWLFALLFIFVFIFIGKPVIFKQPRPGKNNKVFMLYKFRSMTNKTDEKGNLLPDAQRITKLGKFLRTSSLDELPQLFNILKGDMSLIGPRPKLVKDVIFYSDDVKSLMVKPGITGLAQVNGRNNNTWDSMFIYDKLYIKNMSFKLDVKIFFKTFIEVFKRTGVNSGATNMLDYYYGDYLLRTGKITQEEYNIKMKQAKARVEAFTNSKKIKKLTNSLKTVEEDFDLEHKTNY